MQQVQLPIMLPKRPGPIQPPEGRIGQVSQWWLTTPPMLCLPCAIFCLGAEPGRLE